MTNERRKVSQLRRRYHNSNNQQDKKEWKKAQQTYYDNINSAKAEHWREFVTTADGQSIWKVKKYMESTPLPTFIPTLNEIATTNKEKEFQKTFFPPPPSADLSDIDPTLTSTFKEVLCNFQITRQQVVRAISKVSSDKAPGPDEITNRVIKENVNILVGHIQASAQASLNIGYFPAVFKQTITAVLRKPCKPDYTSAKAY